MALYALDVLALPLSSLSLLVARSLLACAPFRLVIPFLPPIFLLDRAHLPPPLRLDLASKMLSLTRFSLMGSKKVETKIRDVAARESTSIYPSPPPERERLFLH